MNKKYVWGHFSAVVLSCSFLTSYCAETVPVESTQKTIHLKNKTGGMVQIYILRGPANPSPQNPNKLFFYSDMRPDETKDYIVAADCKQIKIKRLDKVFVECEKKQEKKICKKSPFTAVITFDDMKKYASFKIIQGGKELKVDKSS